MKRILTLILALCLILGLSSIAWAAGDITNVVVVNGTVITASSSIEITGTIPDNTATDTYVLKEANGIGSFTLDAPGGGPRDFRYIASASNVISNNLQITLILEKTVDSTVLEDGRKPFTFTLAQTPTMTASNIKISCPVCGNLSASAQGSNSFQFILPAACVVGSHNLSVKVELGTGLSSTIRGSDGLTGITIPGSTISDSIPIVVSNIAPPPDVVNYTLNILRSNDGTAAIGSVTLSGGATASTSSASTNINQPIILEIPNTASGTINIAATASASGAFATPSVASVA
ncbi:MAG: hypothetical protein FWF04_01095, partial [Clostridiales bacterium]|nr:hypothetical protein [Clostridiales bacterium]